MRLSRKLYRATIVARDVEAVQRGRVLQRAENKLIGRMLGKATRGLWRR